MATPPVKPNRLSKVTAVARELSHKTQARSVAGVIPPVNPPRAQAQKLVIRRATFLDITNIYRGLIADEARREVNAQNDDTARTAYILTTIAQGFVVVVEVMGRIHGAVGFMNGAPGYALKSKLVQVFQYMTPSLQRPEIINKLSQQITDFADEHKVGVEITVDDEVANYWEDRGFMPTGVRLEREPHVDLTKPIVDADEPGADDLSNDDDEEFGDLNFDDQD